MFNAATRRKNLAVVLFSTLISFPKTYISVGDLRDKMEVMEMMHRGKVESFDDGCMMKLRVMLLFHDVCACDDLKPQRARDEHLRHYNIVLTTSYPRIIAQRPLTVLHSTTFPVNQRF